ncbi:MAG: hypothetical protein ACC707_19605 [Thiohalomonadales bacterium]
MKKSEWQLELAKYNKKKNKEPIFFNTTLTPEDADYLLEDNLHNRTLKKHFVARYYKEMQLGRWKLNGETIIINNEGALLDGQHRLVALKKYEKPVRFSFCITTGKDNFSTLDMGVSRTPGDLLKLHGFKSVNNNAAAMRFLLIYQQSENFSDYGGIHPMDILNAAKKYPKLLGHLVEAGKFSFLTRCTIMQFFIYIFEHVDYLAALEFFDKLRTGENIGKTSPILHLRTLLLGYRVKNLQYDKRYQIAAFIIAFNAFRNKARVSTVKWDGKHFPVINGVDRDKLFQPN